MTPGNGATIVGNTVRLNAINGITAVSDSLIARNHCTANGTGAGAGNFIITGTHNRIEGNNATSMSSNGPGPGFYVTGANNLIFGNSSSGASVNWNFTTACVYGPIVDRRTPPTSGASGSGNVPSQMGTTDPFANFSY